MLGVGRPSALRSAASNSLARKPNGVLECPTDSTLPSSERNDDRMKRMTVTLPDDLVDKIKRAAGGEGQVASYVATALTDYQERESLDEILAAWRAETPIPDDVRRVRDNSDSA